MYDLTITGVDVFLEKRKTRLHVGTLSRAEKKFIFTYNEAYFTAKKALALGPEFPLTQRRFESTKLFPSFKDRIPSRENPAYPEYCESVGISKEEKDPFMLLCTIGSRGPSSFVFAPFFGRKITAKELVHFRTSLDLTTREFSAVFELSQSSLNALERNRAIGKDLLKRLELVLKFPEVALYFLRVNGGFLMHEKWTNALRVLRTRQEVY